MARHIRLVLVTLCSVLCHCVTTQKPY